jgi:hypothetical protein
VSDKRDSDTIDSDWQSAEEHLARELLNYFTGQRPTGVNYDNQPEEVRELWLGAARVAMKALQEFGREGGLSVFSIEPSKRKARGTLPKFEPRAFADAEQK